MERIRDDLEIRTLQETGNNWTKPFRYYNVLHLKRDAYLPSLSDFRGSELGEIFRKIIGVTRYFMVAA
jgi:hypothetical protein